VLFFSADKIIGLRKDFLWPQKLPMNAFLAVLAKQNALKEPSHKGLIFMSLIQQNALIVTPVWMFVPPALASPHNFILKSQRDSLNRLSLFVCYGQMI
jgi:hypothetical protein